MNQDMRPLARGHKVAECITTPTGRVENSGEGIGLALGAGGQPGGPSLLSLGQDQDSSSGLPLAGVKRPLSTAPRPTRPPLVT